MTINNQKKKERTPYSYGVEVHQVPCNGLNYHAFGETVEPLFIFVFLILITKIQIKKFREFAEANRRDEFYGDQ